MRFLTSVSLVVVASLLLIGSSWLVVVVDGTNVVTQATPPRPVSVMTTYLDTVDTALGLSLDDRRAKRKNMKTCPHDFYRATPALFYRDTQTVPTLALSLNGKAPAPSAVIALDTHVGNLGTFRGPSGDAVWGINDFDQAGQGPVEIDLARTAASAILHAEAVKVGAADSKAAVTALLGSYQAEIEAIATSGTIKGPFLTKSEVPATSDIAATLTRYGALTREKFLAKLCTDDKFTKFKLDEGKVVALTPSDYAVVSAAITAYTYTPSSGAVNFAVPIRVLDVVGKRGSGGSSYGLLRYQALLANANPSKAPIVLELKQAPPSPFLDPTVNINSFSPANILSQQTELGGSVNSATGSSVIGGKPFYVRELEPEKGALELEENYNTSVRIAELTGYIGRVLARSHARTQGKAKAIAVWLNADRTVIGARLQAFATDYALQTNEDYKAFN